MISSKAMYSKYFQEYRLSEAALKKLQNTLFEMLLDIDRVCRHHQISYMLSGGTLLGAVRHKDFIPWDDDIDVMMTRENYQKFRRCFSEELGGKYLLAEPLAEKYFFKMPKVYLKNSTYIEIPWVGVGKYEMAFIDIFIIEYLPDAPLKRKILEKTYDFAYRASSLCIDYRYPSPPILEKAKENREVADYYRFRRRLGLLFTIFGGIRFYLKLAERIAARAKKSNTMAIPSGIRYAREMLPAGDYESTRWVTFRGHSFRAPANCEGYLTNLYGPDYMDPPPESKREIHVAYRMNLEGDKTVE